jgi:two-component system sensor histidine kinase PilS (NtrC family)
VLITALVYISGGLKGNFYFLYVFPILAAGVIISRRAAFQIAALAALFFGGLVDGLAFKVIPYYQPQAEPVSAAVALNSVALAWGTFFLIAFLVGYFTQSLQEAKKHLDNVQRELELKRKLALAGEVFAQVAHEIRNPLAAISGSVQILSKERNLTPEQKSLMDIVVTESQRISRILDQYLILASPRKETMAWINLSKILDETLILLEKGGELNDTHKIEGNFKRVKIKYFGNENQFRQLFWNLTKNALKAMPQGGTLKIDFYLPDSRTLKISFQDTGKGMTEEEKRQIFEPFYSGFTRGNGIGMSVVRRIIDDYGGKIEVDSQPYQGTKVLITLPRKE